MANGASGGTAETPASESVVSQQAQVAAAEGAGADATQVAEPTIEVDGEQIPLSKVKAGLGALKTYTQTQQQQAAREREIAERELALRSTGGLVAAISAPGVAEKLGEVAPEVLAALPDPTVLAADAIAAENLTFRFEKFATEHPEFTDEMLTGIAAEAKTLAMRGDFAGAKDFDTIGIRLYRDEILANERARALADAQAAAKAAAAAGVVQPGVAPVQSATQRKVPALSRIALGHAEAEAKRKAAGR